MQIPCNLSQYTQNWDNNERKRARMSSLQQHRLLSVLGILTLLWGCLPFFRGSPEPQNPGYEEGSAAAHARAILKEKGYWDALPYYFQAIQEADLEHAHLLRYELAMSALREGERDVALDLLSSILSRDPHHPLALPLYRSLTEPLPFRATATSNLGFDRVKVLISLPKEYSLSTSSPLFSETGAALWQSYTGPLTGILSQRFEVLATERMEPFAAELNGIRTSLRLFRVAQGVVLELPLEDYLLGVVTREMGPGFPMEALKAQAVLSRTLLYELKSQAREGSPYHVRGDISHQAFGIAETSETIRNAVVSTRGEILTYARSPAVVFFHADNGGVSEDPRFVWGFSLPYYSIRRDPFSNQVPRWSYRISIPELRRILHFKELTQLRMLRSPSGRVTRLILSGGGIRREIKGNEFRLLLGSTQLRSLMIHLRREGEDLVFEGRGYGHGVGMSQWGARRMAERGLTYQEILSYYYPGTEIIRLPDLTAKKLSSF